MGSTPAPRTIFSAVSVFKMDHHLSPLSAAGCRGRLAVWLAPIGIIAFLLSMVALEASVVPGSTPKDWPANPQRHGIQLKRTPEDEASLKKIALAENAMSGTNAWSRGSKLGIRLPFSLTRDALEYYEGLVRGYQKRTWKTYVEPKSGIDYTATVSHKDSFERDGRSFREVDVVEMKLSFHADFTEEGTQGVHFEKSRTVVLDAKGRVVAVFGDGPTFAPVLAI